MLFFDKRKEINKLKELLRGLDKKRPQPKRVQIPVRVLGLRKVVIVRHGN